MWVVLLVNILGNPRHYTLMELDVSIPTSDPLYNHSVRFNKNHV